jgi:hypothetical protein
MPNKKLIGCICLFLSLYLLPFAGYAQSGEDGIGQTIQIYTRFQSFVGKPSWLLVIRDLDHNENIPYLFDIKRGNNFWLALTRGRNYLIVASTLQIETYNPRCNTFKKYKIHNFCHLESHGRIIRGESMYVTINGNLAPNTDRYTCNVSSYADANFTIAPNTALQ